MNAYQNLPLFDESALEQLHELQVEGEPSFVGGLITDYLGQAVELNDKVQSFQTTGDQHSLERAAHKLKSSSAVLGLARVAAICFAIEDTARNHQNAAEHVNALATTIPESLSVLRAYLAKL